MRRGSPLRTSCPDEQLFLPRHAGRFFSVALCLISALKKLWRYTAGSVHFTYRLRRSRITCRIAVGLLRSPDLRDLNGRRFASLTRRHHWTVSPPLANLATTYDFKSVAAEAGSGGAAFLLHILVLCRMPLAYLALVRQECRTYYCLWSLSGIFRYPGRLFGLSLRGGASLSGAVDMAFMGFQGT